MENKRLPHEGSHHPASLFKESGFGNRNFCNPYSRKRSGGVLKPKRVFTMKPTKEELLDIIYQSLEEVNEQLPNDQRVQKSPDAILVGRAGGLDSLGFVNFIALVEEKCAHKYGIALSLMEASSSKDDALENVGRFADSLFQYLTQAGSVEV